MTALTDKYRPKRLEDVIGQDHVSKGLREVVNGKRAKAFIFSGPSGCGKTTLARILASEFSNGQAFVTNVSERDGAFASGADSVRELVSGLAYQALGASPVKAVILDECHDLSQKAWEVLLKPIEEPPAHVYWFLCSTRPDKIPVTIKTRCLTYTLKLVKEEQLFELLCRVCDEEGFNTSDEVLEAVAEGAGGSPRLALNLLEACHTFQTATEVRRHTQTIEQGGQILPLCRYLLQGCRGGWLEATKLVRAIGDVEPESIRISVVNYLAVVAMNAKTADSAVQVLAKIEAFEKPYNSSDKLAPLLLSIGQAMRLGE